MSRVYFHALHDPAPDGTELYGAERHWCAGVVNRIAMGVLHLDGFLSDWILKVLPADCWATSQPERYRGSRMHDVSMWLTGFDEHRRLTVDGEQMDVWPFILNTALTVGSDAVKLMARIHAQSEVHCYVEGPNRAWLAGIIDGGLASGVYRTGMGWDACAALLRHRSDEPVVLSYSVTDQFPGSHVLSIASERARDRFYKLPEATQWERCMKAIRKVNGLELRPDDWQTLRFGHERDFIWLMQHAQSTEAR